MSNRESTCSHWGETLFYPKNIHQVFTLFNHRNIYEASLCLFIEIQQLYSRPMASLVMNCRWCLPTADIFHSFTLPQCRPDYCCFCLSMIFSPCYLCIGFISFSLFVFKDVNFKHFVLSLELHSLW